MLYRSLVEICPDSKDDHVYDLWCKVTLIEQAQKEATHENNDINANTRTHHT